MNQSTKDQILEALRIGEICTISHFTQLYKCDSNEIKDFHQVKSLVATIALVESLPVEEV